MQNTPPLQFWFGQTIHQRFTPFEQRFRYGLFLMDIDIDKLDAANQASWLFSVGGLSLFSFDPEAHGAREKGEPLRPWAEEKLAGAGVDLNGGTIRLVTFPKHLFYKFAPISLWYGYASDGTLSGIIYEVNNTFGETHCYVANVSDTRSEHVCDKSFHVSPFFDVKGKYKFTLRTPTDKLSLIIANSENDKQTHIATISGRRAAGTVGTLMKAAVLMPLSSLGVSVAIHWQAIKLWIKGAGYRSRPAAPKTSTIAIEKHTHKSGAQQSI